MSVVLSSSISSGNRCRLAYDNILESGTVTASSENASYPVENCYNWLVVDSYKPAATGTHYITCVLDAPYTCDYFAFYGHTVHLTGGTLQLQYKDEDDVWQNASDVITPTNSAPRVITFTEKTATEWRVKLVTGDTIPLIAVLSIGKSVLTPYGVYLGYSDPKFSRANKFINSVSEGGNFLGRSIYARGFAGQLILQYASRTFINDYWMDFVLHAEQKPFFYVWNTDDYPNDAAYCWAEGEIAPPTYTHYNKFMGTSFAIRGHFE